MLVKKLQNNRLMAKKHESKGYDHEVTLVIVIFDKFHQEKT